jgi:hypothetical protein
MLPLKFRFIWPNGFRGEESKKSANQKQESPVAAMFVTDRDGMRTFHWCFLPSFGLFGEAVSEEKIFKNRSIRNKNCLWRPCLYMDRNEIRILYRGPTIEASYQVSVHLAKRFQRRRILKICIEINAFWIQISIFIFLFTEDILEINQSETRIACGGHVC